MGFKIVNEDHAFSKSIPVVKMHWRLVGGGGGGGKLRKMFRPPVAYIMSFFAKKKWVKGEVSPPPVSCAY